MADMNVTAILNARWDMVTTAAVSIDTTLTQALDVTVTFGTQSVNNTITSSNFAFEVLN
jgi:hypothetical protein